MCRDRKSPVRSSSFALQELESRTLMSATALPAVQLPATNALPAVQQTLQGSYQTGAAVMQDFHFLPAVQNVLRQ